MSRNLELPKGFLDRLLSEKPEAFANLADALCSEPSVAVRANMAKGFEYATGSAVPWCTAGKHLSARPQFTLDPALHQGLYYVQDASSMFISMVARQLSAGQTVRWLDACAAPGGKTTCVIDALPEGSLVVANEIVPQRAAVLRENVIKWGNPSVIVTRGDSASLGKLRNCFDVVAADVPCSGEGMMRKDPDAVAQWSPGLIEECASRQREIVSNLWTALASGGHMVYSTCTFNRAENEDMVEYICSTLGGEVVPVKGIDPNWGIIMSDGGYRFIPGRVNGEGLFMAVIRKNGTHSPFKSDVSKPEKRLNPAAKWLNHPGDYIITEDSDGRINAFPVAHSSILKAITNVKGLDVILHGTILGHMKGKDIVPSHALALSTALNSNAFPKIETSREDALNYLRAETITLPSDTPRGHVLLTYSGYTLGFVKHLGNRTNSLFPRTWRIRML